MRRLILPRIMPGVVPGAIFALCHSGDELVLVIAGRDVSILPRRIRDGINENLASAMAAVPQILFALPLLLADRALRRRSEGG